MKIRTAEQLVDFFAAELAWRKKELEVLLALIRKNELRPSILPTVLRSGVTVLYAHWEGFVKAAGIAYLEFVCRQHLTCRELTHPFRALQLKQMVERGGPVSIERAIAIFDTLVNREADEYVVTHNATAISTRSNLNSEVLREIVLSLGLDYKTFQTKENLIDAKLLYYRNNIAHGRDLYPGLDQYVQLHAEVLVS
jgi:hypothetical protein